VQFHDGDVTGDEEIVDVKLRAIRQYLADLQTSPR